MSEILGLSTIGREATLVVDATDVHSSVAEAAALLDDEPDIRAPDPAVAAKPAAPSAALDARRRRQPRERAGCWEDVTRAQMAQVGITFY